MPELLTNKNQELPAYPTKRSTLRKGMGDLRPVKARLGAAGEAFVVDLSENGIGLEVNMPLQAGSSLAVDFDLPESGGRVRVDGRVIWSSAGKRAGIRFERVPDLTSERLKRWINLAPPPQTAQSSPGNGTSAAQPAVDDVPVDETLSLDRAVNQVLARAMTITKADGAAVAIGPPEGMVCRASSGNAPDVGTPINPSAGLTGYCIRNRATAHCNDTETDERVNAAACREMDLRSALIIPVLSVKDPSHLTGILEVFSSQPKAFTPEHIAKLEKLTRILGVVAADLVTTEGAKQPDQARALTSSAVMETPSDAKTERGHAPRKIGDRPLDVKKAEPKLSASSTALSAAGNHRKPQTPSDVKPALAAPVVTTQIGAKETAVKLAELTKPSAPASAKITALDSTSLPGPTIVVAPTFLVEGPSLFERSRGWLASAGDRRTRLGKALRVIGVIVIVLEIAAAVFLATRWERKHAVVPHPAKVTETALPVAAPTVVTSPGIASPAVPAATPSVKRKKQNQTAILPDDGSDEVIIVNRAVETSSTPATGIASAPSTANPTTSNDEPLTPPAVSNQADLAAIRLPENLTQPSLAIARSTGAFGGRVIKRVEPAYPDTAKIRGIQGTVLLNVHVGTDGLVRQVRLAKGNPILGNAATEAVKQWRFEPMKLNGNLVEMDTSVKVDFKLPN